MLGIAEAGVPGNDLVIKVIMAALAVSLYHFSTRFMHDDRFGDIPQCEYGGMTQPVLGFEIVLPDEIVLRHMTVITGGMLPVRAVKPGSVLRSHDMTVYAGSRIIRQVTDRVGNDERIDG